MSRKLSDIYVRKILTEAVDPSFEEMLENFEPQDLQYVIQQFYLHTTPEIQQALLTHFLTLWHGTKGNEQDERYT